MCSWQLVGRNSNYLSELLRDSTEVLPIRQQKVNAFIQTDTDTAFFIVIHVI